MEIHEKHYVKLINQILDINSDERVINFIRNNIKVISSDFFIWWTEGNLIARKSTNSDQLELCKYVDWVLNIIEKETYYCILTQFVAVNQKEEARKIIRKNLVWMTTDFYVWLKMANMNPKISNDPEQIEISNYIDCVLSSIKNELQPFYTLLKQLKENDVERSIRITIKENLSLLSSDFIKWLKMEKISDKSNNKTNDAKIELILKIINEEMGLMKRSK